MQRMQIDHKLNHSLKLINNLTKKIEEMNTTEENIDLKAAEVMVVKTEELTSCQEGLARVTDEEVKIQQEIEKIDTALITEENEIKTIQVKIQEARAFIDEIQGVEASIVQLKAEKNVQAQTLHSLRVTVDSTQNEIIEGEQKIEEMKFQQNIINTKSELLEKHLEEITFLMTFIQSKSTFEELESDEIFLREVVNEPFYIKLKEDSATKMNENEDLIQDLQNSNDNEDRVTIEHEKTQKELAEMSAQMKVLQREVNVLMKEEIEAQKQLQTRVNEGLQADENIKREILHLQTQFVKEEDELDRLRYKNAATLVELNIQLKMEQAKTLQARQRQIAMAKEEKELSLTMNSSLGGLNTSHSQPALPKRQKLDEKVDEKLPHSATQRQHGNFAPATWAPLRRALPTSVMSSSFESTNHRNQRGLKNSMVSSIPVYKKDEEKVTPPAIDNQKQAPPTNTFDEEAFSDQDSSVSYVKLQLNYQHYRKFPFPVQRYFQHRHRRLHGRNIGSKDYSLTAITCKQQRKASHIQKSSADNMLHVCTPNITFTCIASRIASSNGQLIKN